MRPGAEATAAGAAANVSANSDAASIGYFFRACFAGPASSSCACRRAASPSVSPITMARVDRLFGVTMAERGVSQLVSVDLTGAHAVREAAVATA